MATISPPNPAHRLPFTSNPRLHARRATYPFQNLPFPSHSLLSRVSDSPTVCHCASSSSSNSGNPSFQWLWDSTFFQYAFKKVLKRISSCMNSLNQEAKDAGNDTTAVREHGKEEGEEEEWDWDRWRRHFQEIDEQEALLSVLKSHLGQAADREDYEDAARLKVAIAAAATSDTVGRVMSQLNRAVAEQRYQDAAFLRDNAGAGLVGWWSGITENVHHPYGLVIRITAEHGRYVARSYSPRQLTTASTGVPLFEIFLTMNNKKGEYKQQAVYLKREGLLGDSSTTSSKSFIATKPSRPNEGKTDLFVVSTEVTEDGNDAEDDSDSSEDVPSFRNILQDIIPIVKVKVLKVTAPTKVDKDFIAKLIQKIIDDEDKDEHPDLGSAEADNDVNGENNQEMGEIEMDVGGGVIDNEQPNEISVKVVIRSRAQKNLGRLRGKDLRRVPAKLEKKGHGLFSFSVENVADQKDSGVKAVVSADRKAKLRGKRSLDHVMIDLAESIRREKIPAKVLKNFRELMNFTLSETMDRQPLSGPTTFHQIEISESPDPLNGLYISVRGTYSEVINLQRKFGQWQDDRGSQEPSDLEFYEYVEAIKLTGDPFIPAGQVSFRAKVGKRYKLQNSGIIPKELGVIARYKGQGKIADPGFQNPRWVDGELVILDGKFAGGEPVVGFLYWDPQFHFMVFLNRLRLQQ